MKDIIFDCIKKTSDVMYVFFYTKQSVTIILLCIFNKNNTKYVLNLKTFTQVCLGLLLALDPHCRGKLLQSRYCLTVKTTIQLKSSKEKLSKDDYLIFPQVLSIIVFDPFTELFITLCIMVSALLKHHHSCLISRTLF